MERTHIAAIELEGVFLSNPEFYMLFIDSLKKGGWEVGIFSKLQEEDSNIERCYDFWVRYDGGKDESFTKAKLILRHRINILVSANGSDVIKQLKMMKKDKGHIVLKQQNMV